MLGLFLEELRDHLRTKNNWTQQSCGIQFEATPPFTSPEWYVALDDNGVSQTSNDINNHMREVARIQIGIWRRQGENPADRSGVPMMYTDGYRPGRETLDRLERDVIRYIVGLPHRNELVDQINKRITDDQDEFGWCVLTPLRYLGRGRNETYVPSGHVGGDDIATYLGRRLNFEGLIRIQGYDENLR